MSAALLRSASDSIGTPSPYFAADPARRRPGKQFRAPAPLTRDRGVCYDCAIIISLQGGCHMTRWATLAIALLFSAIAARSIRRHRVRPGRRRLDHPVRRQEPRSVAGRRHRHLQDRGRLGRRRRQEGPQGRRGLSGHQAVLQGLRAPRRVLGQRRRQQRHLHPLAIRARSAPRPATSTTSSTSARIPTYGTGSIVYIAEVDPMPKAGGKWNTMEISAKGRISP